MAALDNNQHHWRYWICEVCTYAENGPNNTHCAACEYARGTTASSLTTSSSTPIAPSPTVLSTSTPTTDNVATTESAASTTEECIAAASSTTDEEEECIICCTEIKSSEKFPYCEQVICLECVKSNAKVSLDMYREKGSVGVCTMMCPMRCHELEYWMVRDYCGLSSDQLQLFNSSRRSSFVASYEFQCPSHVEENLARVSCANCNDICEASKQDKFITCRCCERSTCIAHGQLLCPHDLSDSSLDKQRVMEIPNIQKKAINKVLFCSTCFDSSLAEFTPDMAARLGYKPCPKCNTNIEKNGGCKHMTCTTCKHEYFWCCLRSYRDPKESRAHYQSQTEACNARG